MRNSPRTPPGLVRTLVLGAVALGLGACGGQTELPSPRPLVIHSGARLRPEPARMDTIDKWLRTELTDIREDPSFLIRTLPRDDDIYPWEGLSITADTADVEMQAGVPEVRVPYMIYAHLHLMDRRGELEEWLPDVAGSDDFTLERAILRRTAEAWIYGRSVWDAPPHDVMDEIMYANEKGYLDAMIFTARPDAFGEARRAWARENPGGIEEYRRWFVETFDREPPGLREESETGS